MSRTRNASICLLGVLVLEPPALGEEKKYVEIQWVDRPIASIELLQENVPRVSLPISLQKAIARYYPNYRLPRNEDYKGDWAESYDYLSPEERESKAVLSRDRLIQSRVPFIALGDFNHDKIQDIAAFILHKKRDNVWKLVVFHGSKAGFRPMVIVSSPRGKDFLSLHNHGINARAICSNGKECFEFFIYESTSFEYAWKNGRYIQIATSDD